MNIPWARVAALSALVGVVPHLVVIVGHAHWPFVSLLMGLMVAACLGCAVHSLRAPSGQGLIVMAGMSAVMALLHVGWVLAMLGADRAPDHHPSAHHHQHTLADPSSGIDSLWPMAGLTVWELVTVVLCLVASPRAAGHLREPSLTNREKES